MKLALLHWKTSLAGLVFAIASALHDLPTLDTASFSQVALVAGKSLGAALVGLLASDAAAVPK